LKKICRTPKSLSVMKPSFIASLAGTDVRDTKWTSTLQKKRDMQQG
jgi:hypothetical protein